MRLNSSIIGPKQTPSRLGASGFFSVNAALTETGANTWPVVGLTGYKLQNASFTSQASSLTPANGRGIDMSSDGTSVIICMHATQTLYQYPLSTAYDATTFSNVADATVSLSDTRPFDCRFSSTGHKVYVTGNNDKKVEMFSLSTNYDLSTAGSGTLSSSLSTLSSSANTNLIGLAFKPDGSKMFIADQAADKVFSFSMSTAWDISSSSLSYDSGTSFSIPTTLADGSAAGSATALDFSSDGKKMFIMGSVSDKVTEFELDPAWDISSATETSHKLSVGTQEWAPQGMCFGDLGEKFYIIGNTKTVFQYETDG